MKMVNIKTNQNNTGWAGETRFFYCFYFALVGNYIFKVGITLRAGIKSFEDGITLVKWESN